MTDLLAWGPRGARSGTRPEAGDQPQPLPAHAGLWIDRLVDQPWSEGEKGWPARNRLYEAAVAALKPGSRKSDDPPALRTYVPLFNRWRQSVTAPIAGTCRRVISLEAKSRLLLHPASNESVTEGSLLLHHTYGVPYLPGSALKGVARARLLASARHAEDPATKARLKAWAEGLLGFVKDGKAARGTPGGQAAAKTHGSLVEFLDALWIPPEGSVRSREVSSPLALDVVTPHHPDYYTAGAGSRRPSTDGDSPIPVQRLTVAPGARFLAVVEAAADLQPWLDWLLDSVLLPALKEEGLGARTSAGYGRLEGIVGGRSQAPPATRSEWQSGEVFWQANRRELEAVLGGRDRAFARGSEVEELLKTLPDDVRRTLLESRKRKARLEVQIVEEGASWKITGLRPPTEP